MNNKISLQNSESVFLSVNDLTILVQFICISMLYYCGHCVVSLFVLQCCITVYTLCSQFICISVLYYCGHCVVSLFVFQCCITVDTV